MRYLTRLTALTAATFAVIGSLTLAPRTQASVPATPGVTSSQILIGTSLPRSGIASVYSIIADAEKAYFDSVNAQGGIYGRKLRLVALDDQYQPDRTLANVRNLVLAQNVFALLGTVGTDNTKAILPFITQQKVPLVVPLTGSSAIIHPLNHYVFDYLPSYTVEAKVLTDYAVNTLHAHKIGVFYQNDDFGKEGLAAATARARQDGAQVVSSQSYQLTDVDVSTQVQTLQQSGADTVIMFALPQQTEFFFNTAAQTGYRPHLLYSSIAVDTDIIQQLHGAEEGAYFDAWLPNPASQDPHVVAFRAMMAKYGGSTPVKPSTEAAVATAQILVEGLRRAGRNLTRDSLIKALESLHNWNGGLAPNVTYSASRHEGPEGAYMGEVHGNSLVPVSSYKYP